MELNQMEYFLTVARSEHVTRAAEALNMTQPALSHSLAKLEEELGVQLFERSGRNVQLNRYGKLFARRVEAALEQIRIGKRELAELADPDTGLVSLAYLNILGSEVVPQLIRAFQQSHPGIRFRLEQGNHEMIRESLESGESDLGMTCPGSNEIGLSQLPLFTRPMYAVVPSGHHLDGRKQVHLAELEGEPFIEQSSNCGFRASLELAYRRTGFEPSVKYRAEDLQTVAGFVSAGFGVALLPASAGLKLPNMHWIAIKDKDCKCDVVLVRKDKRYLSPAVKLFRDFAIEYCNQKEKARHGD
ncbi:LysR family transcriptional regulator [Cohnella endophytica]|uniref:LysR family transcriptional regulator n=1 Tax=Cohnella endophytica TaxID=2419778 RepID=A0A494XUH1_9BACL|nr:LysR family transcriptional regulator [Cohnella endophytica]RKP54220.1 LysR family transcriptional regulator [Cohnella endophytica]